MLKFLSYLFFFDVFVSAQTNTPMGRGNTLSSSSLTRNSPIHTSRPNSQPQYPPNAIQYSSSPNAELVGGSVYSDGSGIHVHRHPYPGNSQYPSYTDQSIVYQPGNFHSELQFVDDDPYKYYGSSPSYESYYPSPASNYPSYASNYPSYESNYPSYESNYPSYESNYPSYDFTGIHTPTGFIDIGMGKKPEGGIFNLPGVAPQNMIPGARYLPSNFMPTGMGLGRVMPLSDPYEPDFMQPRQPIQESGLGRVLHPTKDHARTDALLMFTLGRALGQLDKTNNQSTASIVEKFFEMTHPKVQSPPWGVPKWGEQSSPIWGRGPWDQPSPISSMWGGEQSSPIWGQGQWDQPSPISSMWGPWEQPQPTTWGQWDPMTWEQQDWAPPQSSPLQYPELQWGGQPPISPWNQWGQPERAHRDFSMPPPWNQPSNIWSDNTFSNPWGPSYDPWWSVLFDKNEPKEEKEEKKPWWYELLKPKIDEED